MQIVSAMPYDGCQQGVNTQNHTHYFDLFSCASNLRSLQATYLKYLAEYVDKLVQIVYKKFKNHREKDNGCTKMEKSVVHIIGHYRYNLYVNAYS